MTAAEHLNGRRGGWSTGPQLSPGNGPSGPTALQGKLAQGGQGAAGGVGMGGLRWPPGRCCLTSSVCLGEEVSPRISGTWDQAARAS